MATEAETDKGLPLGMDETMVDEYASQSKLLQEFVKIPSCSKAWIFSSKDGMHCCCCPIHFLTLRCLISCLWGLQKTHPEQWFPLANQIYWAIRGENSF
jgi:hypothetical protein